jgi:hypothetical protein
MYDHVKKHLYPLALLALLGAMVLIYAQTFKPPQARELETPSDQFSAMRAFVQLEDILAENVPHPAGSAANKRIRQRLEDKFSALGLEPQIQSDLICGTKFPGCTEVENIIAVQKGSDPALSGGKAIMLTAHYDSVAAGPGAGDDGAGVAAILEIARILSTGSPLANDVIYLITDGEESGLRGAELFAKDHPLMGRIGVIVNAEARGASGPAFMFQTSANNKKLIDIFAPKAPHPAANSLSVEIYKRLPNDTDYSVYKDIGVPGLNFAFVGGASLYHSERDDLAHLSKNSLQHLGESALAAVRQLGSQNIDQLEAKSDSTYFDVFSKKIIAWPAPWNTPLAGLAILLITVLMVRQAPFSAKRIMQSTLILVGLVLLPILVGWLLSFPLGKWPQMHPLDHAFPWPGRIALIGAAVMIALTVSKITPRWLAPKAILLGAYWLLAVLALVMSLVMTGATYLLLVPALLFCLGAGLDMLGKSKTLFWAAHLGFIGALYMAISNFITMDVVANFPMSHVKMVPLVFLTLTLAPLLATHWQASKTSARPAFVVTALVLLLATLIGNRVPGFSSDHPRGQNLVYLENADTGKAEWISEVVGGQDPDFLQKAGFPARKAPYQLYGMYDQKRIFKPAKTRHLPAPRFTLISDETVGNVRTITGEISSAGQATVLALGFDADALPTTLSINDQPTGNFTLPPDQVWRSILITGPKPEPYKIIIETNVTGPFPLTVIDVKHLNSNETEGMAALRPDNSAPAFRGDRSILVAKYSIGAQ